MAANAHGKPATVRTIPIALVQFESVAEQVERNVREVERLTEQATTLGARWVMFHEGTLCDYTPNLARLAEPVPDGKSVRRLENLARRLRCFLSYGLSEVDGDRLYITQVFTGPEGFIYRYRKTWIWHNRDDVGYRDEWIRYDPGSGPAAFTIDGVRSTCFICADGNSRRCLERAGALLPEVVFHPNNRRVLEESGVYDYRARIVGAPLLVTNRVGESWSIHTTGGSAVYSGTGELLARANREGREEILRYDLKLSRP